MSFLPSKRSRVFLGIGLPILLYLALFTYRSVRWQFHLWLPALVTDSRPTNPLPDGEKHLIFLLTDHYEPGAGEAGSERNRRWLEGPRPIADRHLDSAGNKFQYSWFYPYEHRNEEVLASLSQMAREGYGEVELHWHHARSTNERFPASLDSAIAWFQNHDALISAGPEPETHFGFIHGNWALDGSKPFCGVSRELEILQSRGCYADFTFSTIGTDCQPTTVNRIYYADETPEAKSYETGTRAAVGQRSPAGFMIFEGPLAFDWIRVRPEYGAVGESEPTERQIHQWIDADIHVEGRPEWVFVKAYAHGIQTRTIDSGAMAQTLEHLERVCEARGLTLHYMTAREAYNVVKAAEDGQSGNPEAYRDYRIPRPANRAEKDGS
jgi:hypothetical protein